MKGIKTVKEIAVAGVLYLFDINTKLKLLISRIRGTRRVVLPIEKDKGIPKWIHPNNRERAVQRAKHRANASRWNLEVAVFLFGVLAIIVILGNQGVGILMLTLVAILGLTTVWMVGRRQGENAYQIYIDEELAKLPDEWKDYYKILHIAPNAKLEKITEIYEKISETYEEIQSGQRRSMYSVLQREADEAYQVLSVPVNRANYDYVYWLKYNESGSTEFDYLEKEILVNLSQAITRQIENLERGTKWGINRLTVIQKKTLRTIAIVLLSVFIGGTSFTFANPEHVLAAPFRGTAIVISETMVGTVELIEVIRAAGANSERRIVSTALQSMRVQNDIKIVPIVTVPTNDMAYFPSQQCCLFPDYLEKRFTQFKYTVNNKGNVSVDTTWATTDGFIENIKQLIERLERGN